MSEAHTWREWQVPLQRKAKHLRELSGIGLVGEELDNTRCCQISQGSVSHNFSTLETLFHTDKGKKAKQFPTDVRQCN